MNPSLIDKVANFIGSADIGAAWSVNDYPDSVAAERYRKLARAAIEAFTVRRHGCVLLVVDDGSDGRDHLLEALDRVMVRDTSDATRMEITACREPDLAAILPLVKTRPDEPWRRGRPLR